LLIVFARLSVSGVRKVNRLLKSVLLTFCSLATVACTTPPKVLTEPEPFDPHNKWGFVDSTGKVVIEPKYEAVKPFSEGLAAVVKDRRWGYIDKTGKEVIEPKYDVVTPFSNDMAAVSKGGKWGYIDKTGKLKIELNYDNAKPFSEDFAGVQEGNTWSYITKEGKPIAGGYRDVGKFACGLGAFRGEQGWGFIDETGKVIIKEKYSQATAHNKDCIAEVTTLDGRFGLIDKAGVIVYKERLEAPSLFADGLSVIETKGRWGFVDKTGKFVIPATYFSAEKFNGGLALVRTKDGYGYVDPKGKMVIEAKFPNAQSFTDGEKGLAAVRIKDGKWGYIDRTGKLVIESKYQAATPFVEELAAVQVD